MREKTKEFWKVVWGETRKENVQTILGLLSLTFVAIMIIYELAK